jgi:predicted PurR-regulated permease PerM
LAGFSIERRETGDALRKSSLGIIAAGVIIALLYWGRVFFITSIVAIIGAFILEPMVSLLTRVRIPRAIGAFIVIGLAGLALYIIGAAAWGQVSTFALDLPAITDRVAGVVDRARTNIETLEAATARIFTRRPPPPEQPPAPARTGRRRSAAAKIPQAPSAIPEVRIREDHNVLADYLYERIGTVYQSILMASFVPFLIYFMLSWQEHIYRRFLQFFSTDARITAARSLRGIGDLVRAFVVGNFLLGVLLAVLSSVTFWSIQLPYPLLAGTLSGFLSLVPYLGLPLALIVPAFASFAAGGTVSQFLLILAVVTALHVIALNVLYPKLVGARVHLNPLVVTFALMFWSFLWDGAGLVLAIPVTAAIKAVCDNVAILRPYGRFLGD